MNKITKQCVAAVASLAMAGTLCVAGAVVAGSSAWADQTPEKAPWDTTLESNKKGSITITKYRDEIDSTSGKQAKKTPVEGAKFKVYKVLTLNKKDVNLKEYSNWLNVAAMVDTLNKTPDLNNADQITLDAGSTEQATNNSGVAKFPNLEIGLYKVVETQAAKDYALLSSPFFMTIPEVTSKDGKTNQYKYDVTVDPKNVYTADAIHKTADTSAMVGGGDTLPYTITTTVKTSTSHEAGKYTEDDFTGFAVWDDALKSAYDSDTNVVKSVKIGDKDLKAANGKTYYNVSVVDTPNDTNRSRIKIEFTEDGRKVIAEKLNNDADKSKPSQLTVELKFTLKTTVAAGELINKYGFQPGYPSTTPEDKKPKPVNPDNPDPNSKVTLRDFQIKKVNGTDGKSPLKGAKFAVFANKTDADNCAADSSRPAEKCDNKSTKGFTNNANGTPETGLTTAFKAKVGQEFYVVETVAPEGFVLSPAVDKVTIPNESLTTAYVHNFKDLPNGGPDGGKNWFNLPKTGAAGVIIFALIGLGLVGSGMFVFLKNRKKEEEQAA
ncbi:SpaH/EbpB family LPXTG-anchored major pilin [Gardnerella vaginalis]|uniref:Peptidase n=1 Tax=Gardnerella vaginalis TaxID=2702 RepID=A0A3E1IWH1_GARVA|nr:SpaH/EbpB family LPXTG-anchored major pilin [Gardnerella vaginalis]RFD77322.1 peptidase [Gardnerella vaginalis]